MSAYLNVTTSESLPHTRGIQRHPNTMVSPRPCPLWRPLRPSTTSRAGRSVTVSEGETSESRQRHYARLPPRCKWSSPPVRRRRSRFTDHQVVTLQRPAASTRCTPRPGGGEQLCCGAIRPTKGRAGGRNGSLASRSGREGGGRERQSFFICTGLQGSLQISRGPTQTV